MNKAQLVHDLTAKALEQIAPEELFLLADYDPTAAQFGATSKGPQGFGAETAIALAMPFLIKFFEKFIEKLAANAADSTCKKIAGYLATNTKAPTPEVSDAIRQELIAAGLPPGKADQAVSAVAAVLHSQRAVLAKT